LRIILCRRTVRSYVSSHVVPQPRRSPALNADGIISFWLIFFIDSPLSFFFMNDRAASSKLEHACCFFGYGIESAPGAMPATDDLFKAVQTAPS
jgi:hypothetical protein